MPPEGEAELIERAKHGDREAFAQLYAPLERPLGTFLYRMTAMGQDAEDLTQETALKALETIGELDGASSFRIWIFRIAASSALEYLREQKQWDPDAQLRASGRAGEDSPMRRRLEKLHNSSPHTSFQIREHIDFCFTCMGRTLPPRELASLLLAEVHGFSSEEGAEALGDSGRVFRFRVQQARDTLVDHYETRCALINQQGTCTQCTGLDTLLHGDRRHTEKALFQIGLEPHPDAAERAATFPQRLAIVREIDPLHAEGAKLHDFLMKLTREVNRY